MLLQNVLICARRVSHHPYALVRNQLDDTRWLLSLQELWWVCHLDPRLCCSPHSSTWASGPQSAAHPFVRCGRLHDIGTFSEYCVRACACACAGVRLTFYHRTHPRTYAQVRMNLGAFPSCAVLNANGIPLAPFGPVAVSPACGFNPAGRRVFALESTPTLPPTAPPKWHGN